MVRSSARSRKTLGTAKTEVPSQAEMEGDGWWKRQRDTSGLFRNGPREGGMFLYRPFLVWLSGFFLLWIPGLICWAENDIDLLIEELRRSPCETEVRPKGCMGGFGISMDQVGDAELRRFLSNRANRLFVDTFVKQNQIGQRIHALVYYHETYGVEEVRMEKDFLSSLLQRSALAALEYIAQRRGLYFLEETLTVASAMSTVLGGIRAVAAFVDLVDNSQDMYVTLEEYFYQRTVKLAADAFDAVYQSFPSSIDLVLHVNVLRRLPEDRKREFGIAFYETRYQAWKLATDVHRREMVRDYILSQLAPLPKVDEDPPSIQWVATPQSPTPSESIEFAWKGQDDVTPEDRLEYSYYLEGQDKAWSPWEPVLERTFEGLPEGSYRFEVKARDEAGNISAPISFPFLITTPSEAEAPPEEPEVPGQEIDISGLRLQELSPRAVKQLLEQIYTHDVAVVRPWFSRSDQEYQLAPVLERCGLAVLEEEDCPPGVLCFAPYHLVLTAEGKRYLWKLREETLWTTEAYLMRVARIEILNVQKIQEVSLPGLKAAFAIFTYRIDSLTPFGECAMREGDFVYYETMFDVPMSLTEVVGIEQEGELDLILREDGWAIDEDVLFYKEWHYKYGG